MTMQIRKRIAAVAAAVVMAAQAAAVTVSAADGLVRKCYYYNGVFYTYAADAIAAAGGVSGKYQETSAPTEYVIRYYNATTGTYSISKTADSHEVLIPINSSVASNEVGWFYCTLDGHYYTTLSSAMAAAGGMAGKVKRMNGAQGQWYNSNTDRYYFSEADALDASGTGLVYMVTISDKSDEIPSAINYKHYGYYYRGVYYTTLAAAQAAGGTAVNVDIIYVPKDGKFYYGYYYNGKYYGTLAEAIRAGGTSVGYDIAYIPNNYYEYYGLFEAAYYYNGKYYNTLDEAITAGGNKLGVDIFYSPYGYYGTPSSTSSTSTLVNRYYYNGKYYKTLAEAQAAGGRALGYDIVYVSYYNNSHFSDPYFFLSSNGGISGLINSTTTTTTPAPSVSKTAPAGTPFFYGQNTIYGWDVIVNTINNAKSGASYTIDMNGSATISKNALSAMKGKDIKLTFVLDNGARWTINGKDINTAKEIVAYTEYNIKYIPQKLVKKASKGAVAKAQVGVSVNFESFGTKASITVKFNSKYAGKTAQVYRYDPESNSLKSVGKAKVNSEGRVSFSAKAGGPYLVVIK